MPFVLLILGILFFIVSIQGTQGSFFSLIKSEFVGSNSFVVWAAALVIIGLLGYIKPIRPISHAFLVLIVLVLVLANGKNFVANFNSAIRNPVAPSSTANASAATPAQVTLANSMASGTLLNAPNVPSTLAPGMNPALP
jgi:hypothetical protein